MKVFRFSFTALAATLLLCAAGLTYAQTGATSNSVKSLAFKSRKSITKAQGDTLLWWARANCETGASLRVDINAGTPIDPRDKRFNKTRMDDIVNLLKNYRYPVIEGSYGYSTEPGAVISVVSRVLNAANIVDALENEPEEMMRLGEDLAETPAIDRFSWGPSFSARYLTQFTPKSNPDPYLFSGGIYLRFGETCPVRIGGEIGGKTENYGRGSNFLWFAYLNASSARFSSLQKGKVGLLWQVSGGQEVDSGLNAQRTHAEFGLGLTKKVGPTQTSALFSVGKSWFLGDPAQTTAIATANFAF